MGLIINLDVMMAKRKMSLTQLSEKMDMHVTNLSVLKNGRVKAFRVSTIEALCEILECQPGDLLEYRSEKPTRKKKWPFN